ncbi:Alpha/beta hydrolase fold-1 [Bisporella sp. PMI_857]|nr:Alpha/beta hydrolase fold-1 [Bisporella sp. PMI_857]
MTSQTPKPAILIVHGGYFLPPAWDAFKTTLSSLGFAVSVPRLPTCGDARPPTALLSHDVAAVRTAAQELLSANHKIIVLAHSYGGIVASEALTPDLFASNNENKKGIVSLVYLAAWLVQPGDTLADVIGKYGFQSKVDLGQNEDGTVYAKNAPESFFNDINDANPARASELAKANVTHNWLGATGKVTAAPWKDLPTTYVHTTNDLAIMLPLQESMVKDAVDALGSTGRKIEIETIESAHCPFLSKPDEVVAILERALARIS